MKKAFIGYVIFTLVLICFVGCRSSNLYYVEQENKYKMKLYLVERTDKIDYDEYKSMVVVAFSKEEATSLHPSGDQDVKLLDGTWCRKSKSSNRWSRDVFSHTQWTNKVHTLKITYLGRPSRKYNVKKVIHSSFISG